MSLYHRFHDRFGTAGVILGVIALVLALGGSALAASGALTGKQKKEVEKIAKKYAGKPGAQGPQGLAGPQGPAGSQGSAGANGADGANGATILSGTTAPASGEGVNGDFYMKTGSSPEIFGPKTAGAWGAGTKLKGANGTAGTDGKTILSGTSDPLAEDGEEGDFYINTATNKIFGPKTESGWGAGTSLVGPQGPAGPEGNIKETLPSGIALKGTWSAGPFPATASGELSLAPISYNIPLATSPTVTNFMTETETESEPSEVGSPGAPYKNCSGGSATPTVSSPISESRVLCIFATKEVNWEIKRSATPGLLNNLLAESVVAPAGAANRKFGLVLKGVSKAAGPSYAYGTWVVKIVP